MVPLRLVAGMHAPVLSVNVGLPRDVTWNGKTVRTSSLEISS